MCFIKSFAKSANAICHCVQYFCCIIIIIIISDKFKCRLKLSDITSSFCFIAMFLIVDFPTVLHTHLYDLSNSLKFPIPSFSGCLVVTVKQKGKEIYQYQYLFHIPAILWGISTHHGIWNVSINTAVFINVAMGFCLRTVLSYTIWLEEIR
jgi:hypothetical protein